MRWLMLSGPKWCGKWNDLTRMLSTWAWTISFQHRPLCNWIFILWLLYVTRFFTLTLEIFTLVQALSNGTHPHKLHLMPSLNGKGNLQRVFPSSLMALQHGFKMNGVPLLPSFALSTQHKVIALVVFDASPLLPMDTHHTQRLRLFLQQPCGLSRCARCFQLHRHGLYNFTSTACLQAWQQRDVGPYVLMHRCSTLRDRLCTGWKRDMQSR